MLSEGDTVVKLPISDYVYQYYKEQGIEFTFRQQAHFCWKYHDLLKDRLQSLGELLAISDDEKLNQEIRERLEYEKRAYGCFIGNNDPGCIYVVYPDDTEEYDDGYFSSVQGAVLYGKQHCTEYYTVVKQYLIDKCPKESLKDEEPDENNTIQSDYTFTPDGQVRYGSSYECLEPFDAYDKSRFEHMFLNIKSPFGPGDIVMGKYFECPGVVSTDYDCLEKLYDRHKKDMATLIDDTDNCICIDWIEKDGRLYYDHADPFVLWKIDSWDDKEYWNLLQMLSKSTRAGINMWEWDYLLHEYQKHHGGEDA